MNYDIAAVGVASAVAVSQPVVLLVIPWLSLAFGWTFILNDVKVGEIGRYLREVYPETSWEHWRMRNTGWMSSMWVSLVVQILVFAAPAIVATAFYVNQLGSLGTAELSGLVASICCVVLLLAGIGSAAISRSRR